MRRGVRGLCRSAWERSSDVLTEICGTLERVTQGFARAATLAMVPEMVWDGA